METATENTVTISVPELEAIIQRIVKETMREELSHWFSAQNDAWFEFWTQEGEDDPAEEEEIVKDAMEILRQREVDKTGWKSLEEFEVELAAANCQETAPQRFNRRKDSTYERDRRK